MGSNATSQTDQAVAGGSSVGVGSLFFNASQQANAIDCGVMYPAAADPFGHFVIEAWHKPTDQNLTGYWFVANPGGGAHVLIVGYASNTLYAPPLGKYYQGSPDYVCLEGAWLNDWAHTRMSWNGTELIFHQDGLLSHVVNEATARSYFGTGTNELAAIGISEDHSGYGGNIAQIRIWENEDRTIKLSSFQPERYFRNLRYDGASFYEATALWDMTKPFSRHVADLGEGFDPLAEGVKRKHHGVPVMYNVSRESMSFFGANLYPQFEAGEISNPTYIPTPPATPAGALVFDSFSRPTKTYAHVDSSVRNILGSTESGSLGQKVWSDAGFCIFQGRAAYWNPLPEYTYVETGLADVMVSVERLNDAGTAANAAMYCTGLILRFIDPQNFVYIQAYSTQIQLREMVAGVDGLINNFLITGYTEVKCRLVGTNAKVYADGVQVLDEAVVNTTGTKHGLWAGHVTQNQATARYDNFTILAP